MALLKIAVLGAAMTVLVAVTLAVADGGAPPPVAVGAVRDAHVKLRGSSLGRHLVDGNGRSLYLFEKDRGGRGGGRPGGAPPPPGGGRRHRPRRSSRRQAARRDAQRGHHLEPHAARH